MIIVSNSVAPLKRFLVETGLNELAITTVPFLELERIKHVQGRRLSVEARS